MNELRKKYADYKGISEASVPYVIPIKGKEELEYLVGPASSEFEHIGDGTIEDVLEFTRENGQIDGKILMHHDGGDEAYYGFIFSIDSDHNELKENIPAGERRKIKFHCKNRAELADKFKEFIKLKEVKHYEKIVEQYARPDYAQNLDFRIVEDKNFDNETLEEKAEGNRYAICFDTTPKNELGIHFRPAGTIVNIANQYKRKVSLISGGQESGKNSMMSMVALAISPNTGNKECTVKIEGTDEQSWKTALEIYQLFEKKFGED
jgi:phosphotransferase system HPr (HPr) family protein